MGACVGVGAGSGAGGGSVDRRMRSCLLASAPMLHSLVCPCSLPVANKDDDGSDVHSEQQTRTPKKVARSIRQYRCGRLHPGVAQTVSVTLAPLELATTRTGAGDDSAAGVGGGLRKSRPDISLLYPRAAAQHTVGAARRAIVQLFFDASVEQH